mgnify:CR=1 FL=1
MLSSGAPKTKQISGLISDIRSFTLVDFSCVVVQFITFAFTLPLDLHPNPDIVVDVTETYKYKEQAMQEYFSQHGILNDIHSYIDGLSKVRGYSVGAARGEAFTRIGRMPIRL